MASSNLNIRTHRLSSLRWIITAVTGAVSVVVLGVAIVLSIMLRAQIIDNANRELAAVSKVTAERTFQTLSAADVLTRSI